MYIGGDEFYEMDGQHKEDCPLRDGILISLYSAKDVTSFPCPCCGRKLTKGAYRELVDVEEARKYARDD